MSFDPERLLGWQVPDITQQLMRRDSALYALSTGFGSDPLERDDLRFVDPVNPAMVASPSMALVLGYPGFWLGDPAVGVDSTRVLHLDQAIVISGAIPVEGEVIGRTTLRELIDRGEGRGALLRSERVLSVGGREFACVVQTHLLRSEGGFAERPGAIPPRDRTPETDADMVVSLTLPTGAALLYRLNGDMNPIHADPDTAAKAGFPKPIMHGMGTFGYVCRALLKHVLGNDASKLKSLSMRFTAPTYPGDVLHLHIWKSGAFMLADADGNRRIDDGRFA